MKLRLSHLTAHWVIVDRLIASRRGRIFNTAGNQRPCRRRRQRSLDAVQCAVEVQGTIGKENANRIASEQMRFRIGVHVCDIIVREENLFGRGKDRCQIEFLLAFKD